VRAAHVLHVHFLTRRECCLCILWHMTSALLNSIASHFMFH
jgi:hypothetical protein